MNIFLKFYLNYNIKKMNEDIDYYPELRKYTNFINAHPNHKYGIIHNNKFYLFNTHYDIIRWRLKNNIDHNDYVLYNMNRVKNNYNPVRDIRMVHSAKT